MKTLRIVSILAFVAIGALAPVRAQDKDAKDVAAAIATFKSDADLAKWFNTAYGYAVFPSITKAAVVVGGAGGGGRVFEKGTYIGDAHVSQATIGAQLGGQSFSEVIFFETKAALDRFKENAKKGLMAEASVGGQKFKFTPKK